MNITRTVGTGIAAAFLLAACTGDSDTRPSSNSPSLSVTSSASSTPTPSTSSPATPEEEAQRVIVAYWSALDVLASNPDKSLSDLNVVARAQALRQWQRNLTEMRGQGVKQVGSVVVRDTTATFDAASSLYTVTACIDVSAVNVIDKAGKSVVLATREPRVRYTYKIQRDTDQYFVVEDLLVGKPC